MDGNLTFEQWRNDARQMLAQKIEPSRATWKARDDQNLDLFGSVPPSSTPSLAPLSTPSFNKSHSLLPFRVPAEFIEHAKYVYAFRADDTQAFLYRILWRLTQEDPNLLKISIDPDTRELESRYRAVRRDMHKMKAFVRFREYNERFIAWYKPDHLIVRLSASFFVERFNAMNWSILTTEECAHWDQKELSFTAGLPQSAAPNPDDAEDLWKTYYKSIFNPARIKWKAMTKEMPVRFWKTLPETSAIQELLRTSPERLQKFYEIHNPSAENWIPKVEGEYELTLEDLKAALPKCAACGICERATHPVMGVGPLNAEIALVGEQPGEEEDKLGLPFQGPAGKLLNEALALANLDREKMYVTNAVKAFKWTDREGYGRIHRGSSPAEIAACSPWLRRELDIVKPKKVVCLGRSAAQAVLGKSILMREARGKFFKTAFSDQTLVIPHPSFILRIQDPQEKLHEFSRFVEELKTISFVAAL